MNANLGTKTISGDLLVKNDLSIPNILSYPLVDEVTDYVIEGKRISSTYAVLFELLITYHDLVVEDVRVIRF